MTPVSPLLRVFVLITLSGCVTSPPPPRVYDTFYEHQPRSIVIVPPANTTTAVDAPSVFLTTVSTAFAERGYYVFPVWMVQDILTDLGATDEGAIAAVPPSQFKALFGADAVLYVTIIDWTTSYVVLASSITVGAQYRLVDTATGTLLWKHEERLAQGSGGAGGGGLIGALASAALSAALTASTVDYRPLAIQANAFAAGRPGQGLPAGPYHPQFGKDHEQFQ
ncbi:lipoprotein [Nitrospira sp. KM1]|uniref:GNA1162 family protein n=1 Tax=Nitrospira sp. KM1 TaxID=1936990 RepID=UPI0013A780C0|nr:GNA1162 family protein [Nitrospira sp. KM1]BCA52976.1 lipoprotein [Nitrospira sp. KM1]